MKQQAINCTLRTGEPYNGEEKGVARRATYVRIASDKTAGNQQFGGKCRQEGWNARGQSILNKPRPLKTDREGLT